MFHRFRQTMVRPERERLHGLVEVEETYPVITDRQLRAAGKGASATLPRCWPSKRQKSLNPAALSAFGWSARGTTAPRPGFSSPTKECSLTSEPSTIQSPGAKRPLSGELKIQSPPKWWAVWWAMNECSFKCLILNQIWRIGWDSNPRTPRRVAGFQDRCIQPLCHLSGCKNLQVCRGG